MENLTIRENDENSRIPSWIYHFYDNEEAIYYDMSTAVYSYRVFHLIFNTLLCLRGRRDIWVSSLSVRVNGSANEKRKKLKSFTEMKHAKVPPQNFFFVNSSENERLSLNTIFQFSRQSRNFLLGSLLICVTFVYDYGKVVGVGSIYTRWYFLIQ